MARQPLPLGSYGKIKLWQDGETWIARAQYRDFDGVVRLVKRSGKSRAAAERALRAALAERQVPAKEREVTAQTRFSKVAELWQVEVEGAVDAGRRSPGTLDTYRSSYRRHVKPALGELRVREVTTPVVDRALAVIKPRSTSGARTAKVVASQVMRFVARHGAVAHDPVRERWPGSTASRPGRPARSRLRSVSNGLTPWRPARRR